MVCRGLMLKLHREGLIRLPHSRRANGNSYEKREKNEQLEFKVQIPHFAPIEKSLSEVKPLRFEQVRRTSLEGQFKEYVDAFHYLGYTQPVGEHLKYIIFSGNEPLACMAFSSAPRHIGPRDRFIGWDKNARIKNIHFLAYNTRFLILPHVKVKYLASHILSRISKILPQDWEDLYHHPVYYLETFVDPTRFEGTCYKAANWQYLGLTTGRGKDDKTNKPNRSLKQIYGYPLIKKFKKILCS